MISISQAKTIEAILRKNDCSNGVNRKFWGCRDDKIRKDIIKIFISEKEEPKKEPAPVPDTRAADEENAKREAALAQREAAMLASEALLAKKLAAVDKDKEEVAKEKQRLLDTQKQLQEVQDEQEETRLANETAIQEAERKRLAYEKAQKIAEVNIFCLCLCTEYLHTYAHHTSHNLATLFHTLGESQGS